MKLKRHLVIALLLGAGLCLAGLSGCKQDLDVDRVLYRCGPASPCGVGYTCEEHADHGKVCLPIGADVGDQPDGGQSDGGGDDGGQIDSPTLIIEPSDSPEAEFDSVNVTLIGEGADVGELRCSELYRWPMAEEFASLSQTAEVDQNPLPSFTFNQLDANRSYTAVVEGFTDEGVRRAFGCKQGLDPTKEGRTVTLDLQAQAVYLADAYAAELTATFSDDGWMGEYTRSLARLPTHFAAALFGCSGSDAQPCANYPNDRGLLELFPLHSTSARDYLASAVEQYEGNPNFQFHFKNAMSEQFAPTDDVPEEAIEEAKTLLSRGETAELNVHYGEDTAEINGDILVDGRGFFVSNISFMGGSVSEETMSLESVEGHVHPIRTLTGLMARDFYLGYVPGFKPEEGLSQFSEPSQDSCYAVATDVSTKLGDSEGVREDAKNFCSYLRDGYLGDVETFVETFEPSVRSVSENMPTCTLTEPDTYLEAAWWQEFGFAPLPIFERVDGVECQIKWSNGLPQGSELSVSVKLSATVRRPAQ